MLWSDIPRMIWRDAEYIARLFGLSCVEVHYKGKTYTFSSVEGAHGLVVWYGCVTKA